MKVSRSFRTCARCASLSSRPTQQLYLSSHHPRSSLGRPVQPQKAQSRNFSITTQRHEDTKPANPSKSSTNDFLKDLIRETRATNTPQQKKATAASDWSELLSIARQNIASSPRAGTPRSTTIPPSSLTKTLSEHLSDLENNELGVGPAITLRLRPTLGRTVDNLQGEPSRGFRILERKCAQNSVKQDMRSQEKHVRKGQRKKNLRILRWRKMFMEGFKSELKTIRRMRRQGW